MKKYIKKTLYLEPKHDEHIKSKVRHDFGESEQIRQLIEKDMKKIKNLGQIK